MYDTAKIAENTPAPDGSLRLLIEFSGADEAAIKKPFTVTGSTTALQLRQWVTVQLAELNSADDLSEIPALQVGQTINPAAMPTPPAPTAEQVWLEKAQRLQRATSLNLTNATAVADVAALRTDVNATYQSAYLGKV